MKVLPFASSSLALNPHLWLLSIASCLIAINLAITWRTTQSIDLVLLRSLSWSAALFLAWKQRQNLNLESKIYSSLLGIFLITWMGIRILQIHKVSDSWINLAPFVSVIGLCLLASDVKGLKQYKREIAIVFVSILPAAAIFALIQKFTAINIGLLMSTLAAKFSAFVLWYLGFEVSRQGVDVILPSGAITIYDGCSGLDQMVLLLQIALMVIIIFQIKLYKKILLPLAAIFIGFVVNSFRVAIMAFLVAFSNHNAFEYWHGGTGSQIFSIIAMVLFWGLCNFVFPLSDPEVKDFVE